MRQRQRLIPGTMTIKQAARRDRWLNVPRNERPERRHGRHTVEEAMASRMDMLDLICTWHPPKLQQGTYDRDAPPPNPGDSYGRIIRVPDEALIAGFVEFVEAHTREHRQ